MHFARTSTLMIVPVLVIVVVSSYLPGSWVEAKPSGCKYWCKDGSKRYYCCSNGKKSDEIISWVMEEMENWHEYIWFFLNPWPMIFKRATSSHDWMSHEHPGDVEELAHGRESGCPEVRPHCPRTFDWHQPPTPCDSDHECFHGQKCCYDVCLDHKTCKPSSSFSSSFSSSSHPSHASPGDRTTYH